MMNILVNIGYSKRVKAPVSRNCQKNIKRIYTVEDLNDKFCVAFCIRVKTNKTLLCNEDILTVGI